MPVTHPVLPGASASVLATCHVEPLVCYLHDLAMSCMADGRQRFGVLWRLFITTLCGV